MHFHVRELVLATVRTLDFMLSETEAMVGGCWFNKDEKLCDLC